MGHPRKRSEKVVFDEFVEFCVFQARTKIGSIETPEEQVFKPPPEITTNLYLITCNKITNKT